MTPNSNNNSNISNIATTLIKRRKMNFHLKGA